MSDMELVLQELQKINMRLDSVDQRLDGMDQRLDTIEDKLDTLTDEHAATREGVNRLLGWADECGYIVKLPLPKIL